MIRSWLDEDAKKIVKFATKTNINLLIDVENLPDYMGGNGTKDYHHVPKGVVTIDEMADSIGINNKRDIVKLSEHFQKLIVNDNN